MDSSFCFRENCNYYYGKKQLAQQAEQHIISEDCRFESCTVSFYLFNK